MSLQYYYANFIESVLLHKCIYILQQSSEADLNHFNLVEHMISFASYIKKFFFFCY
jgi:hypothetical protein